MAASLTLFWAWLGVSLAWSPALYVSMHNAWWMGSLPLVFWMYTLAPDRDLVWKSTAPMILFVAVVLTLMAAYQLLILNQAPRSLFLNINSHAAFLNLIALPIAGYFLIVANTKDRHPAVVYLLGCTFFLLTFGLAITKGRAATLAFLICLGLIVITSVKWAAKKHIVILISLVAAAFLLADVCWRGGIHDRLETLYNIGSAGESRFIIWRQSWEMLKASPWLGVGSGLFSLAWPPYRHPDDSSAGYFVHNDYLQIWIELGLPGFVLVLAVLVSVIWMYLRVSRNTALPVDKRVEMAGLIGGLGATALHSAFDFNFYILPILLVGGVTLGRFHSLIIQVEKTGCWELLPSKIFGQPGYRIITLLLVLFPMIYFVSIGLSAYEYEKALELAEKGQMEAADDALSRAARLAPTSDSVLMTRADLYRHLLKESPGINLSEKVALFSEAVALLENAMRLNPLRPHNFALLGQLYQENAALVGKDWIERAMRSYRHALELNPRFYPARLAYAQLMIQQNRIPEAKQSLEEGLRYWYSGSEQIVPYYVLAAKLRREAGDEKGSEELGEKIKQALKNSGWEWVPFSEPEDQLRVGRSDKKSVVVP